MNHRGIIIAILVAAYTYVFITCMGIGATAVFVGIIGYFFGSK